MRKNLRSRESTAEERKRLISSGGFSTVQRRVQQLVGTPYNDMVKKAEVELRVPQIELCKRANRLA